VIVTDHHQPEETLPEALAVIHTTQVCGSAVSWFTAREFDSAAADRALDLAALATISDLMPLKGANRRLVFHGLRSINVSRRPGLKALIQAAGLGKRAIDAGTIGYSLAPRINAMGRLSHGLDALRLLCTKDAGRAAQLAQLVDDTNADRQQLTEDLLQLAKRQVQEQKKESLLIAFSPDFHEGVIGLIAGKLAEWYAKPAIVISTRGEVAKASARSVPGVNITELIRTAKQYLLEAGGHPMAAGFGFEPGKLNKLMEYLFTYARENIDPALLQKTLDIDCPLELQQVTADLVRNIQKFAPFGQENPEPVFALKELRIAQIQRIGAQQQHLKLFLEGTDGTAGRLQALAWGKGEAADNLEAGATADIAGVLQLNAWRDKVSVQLIIRDVRLAESA
jgi:single-stranded-DNA-specific exonuclease